MISVRTCGSQDLPEIARMGVRHLAETRPYLSLDVTDFTHFGLHVVSNPQQDLLIAYKGEEPAGYAYAFYHPHPFNMAHGYTALEYLYVLPKYRGSLVAKNLIKYFEVWSRVHEATECFVGVTTPHHAERLAQFYEHLGYQHVGYSFCKRQFYDEIGNESSGTG